MRRRAFTWAPIARTVLLAAALSTIALLAGAQTVARADGASIRVTRPAGTTVAENGIVKTGESLLVHVTGFAANATVLLQFGPVQLSGSIETDDAGAGERGFVVPAIKSDAYVFTAASDSTTTTFVVSLFNPKNPKPTATPTPSPARTKPHSSSVATSQAASSASGSSGSTGRAALAKTGSTNPTYWLAAVVLIIAGGSLVRMFEADLQGRHERTSGAHLR